MRNKGLPRLAAFLLARLGASYQREALIGDLLEEHARGRSSAWLWGQVICALGSSLRLALRTHPGWIALAGWWGLLLFLTFGLRQPLILFALDPTFYWLLTRKRRLREAARQGLPMVLPMVLLVCVCLASGLPRPADAAQTVTFKSGDRVLHGLLYKPAGAGPFPAVLYNHGSAPGLLSSQAVDLIGPLLAARGWVVFAPYRSGQGTSAGAGPYIMEEIRAAQARGGEAAGEHAMVELLQGGQLQDQMAALAWLRSQPFVEPRQIAAMGNSFGGIETVLGVEQGGYCAGVDAAGGAQSWEGHPELKARMLRAAGHASAPILFLQAGNDYSVAPSRTLHEAMQARGLPSALRIYPAYGSSPEDGHSFAWRGARVWAPDAVAFLETHCKRQPLATPHPQSQPRP